VGDAFSGVWQISALGRHPPNDSERGVSGAFPILPFFCPILSRLRFLCQLEQSGGTLGKRRGGTSWQGRLHASLVMTKGI
jgi:hypothetical protein